MPDNTRYSEGTLDGDTYASDEITDPTSVAIGAKVERVKAGWGADGEYYDPTPETPVPVAVTSLPLPAGAATQGTLTAIETVLAAIQALVLEITTPADTQPVSGTFYQATQPVSAAALPLPTGAATAAKQPAPGTVGSPSADVITVQGVGSSGEVAVGGVVDIGAGIVDIGYIAPGDNNIGNVDIASMPAIPAGANTIGKVDQGAGGAAAWKVDGSAATQPVSAVSLPLPTGAATEATLDAVMGVLDARLPAGLVGGRLDVVVGAALPAGLNAIGKLSANDGVDIGNVDVASLPALTDKASNANNNVIGNVSLGNSQGKVVTCKTGTLASSANTADQVILSYTVTAGKTFYVTHLTISARLTTFAATATLFGTASLEIAGTKQHTWELFHAGNIPAIVIEFPEPIFVGAGVVVRVVCTPSAATAFTWRANFGGYEK